MNESNDGSNTEDIPKCCYCGVTTNEIDNKFIAGRVGRGSVRPCLCDQYICEKCGIDNLHVSIRECVKCRKFSCLNDINFATHTCKACLYKKYVAEQNHWKRSSKR